MSRFEVLYCAGRPVARYLARGAHEGRPYLHPVMTLGGRTVSELRPADHLHHLGVGVAVPDVSGTNFWGGRTYVPGRGPTALDNHGVQRHHDLVRPDDGSLVQHLGWVTADGTELLAERRTLTARRVSGRAWALEVASTLTNTTDSTVSIGSPATNGRPGAAYGGFFWRAPREHGEPDVFTAAGHGEEAVNGTRAEWVALVGRGWTLVFAGADDATRRDAWFVRAAQYPGVGSSLAREGRLTIAPGIALTRRVVTAVADGRLDAADAAALARVCRDGAVPGAPVS